MNRTRALVASLLIALASPASAQDFAVDDSADGAATGRAATTDRADDFATDRATEERVRNPDSAGFNEDNAAVERTFGDSPEGTLQEPGLLVE